jgi:hypothetical protein
LYAPGGAIPAAEAFWHTSRMGTGADGAVLTERDDVADGPDDPFEPDSAPLRDWPLWERLLRVTGAVLVTLDLAIFVYDGLRAPRVLDHDDYRHGAYEQLLGDAAEGRVARVDNGREHGVRWQNLDGAVYQANHSGIDYRAAVERQPYVREHPGSVTYGPIDRRDQGELGQSIPAFFVILFLLGTLFRRPRPRLATRWAWVWVVVSTVGVPFYLLFSGSWVRPERPGADHEGADHGGADHEGGGHGWLLGGVAAYLALMIGGSLLDSAGTTLYERGHPVRGYGAIVLPAEVEPFASR